MQRDVVAPRRLEKAVMSRSLADDEESATSSEPKTSSAVDVRTMTARATVFIADDDAVFRSILRKELHGLGYDVCEVSDGAQAIEALALAADGLAAYPDVVLLDVCMPELSGLGVLRMMRRFSNPPPTFLLTGFADPSVDVVAHNLGATRLFHKPIDLEELVSAVLDAVKSPGKRSSIPPSSGSLTSKR